MKILPMIAGNWKMNTTVDSAVKLVKSMLGELEEVNNVESVLCPPFVSLAAVRALLKGSRVMLGAQDVFYEDKGAYTGEISPLMLVGLCEYVIIGHSERRHYFGESDEDTDKKVKAALEVELKPILCIGETLEENEAGRTEEVLTRQLEAADNRLYYIGGMVVAYEPVWAIGTGRSASGEQANKTIAFIRQLIDRHHGDHVAREARILYGGSVNAENIGEIMGQPEIDGALVGGASLKAADFISIVKKTAEMRGKR